MNKTLVILTPGQSAESELIPLLLTQLPAGHFTHSGLLDGMTLPEIERQYGVVAGENGRVITLNDGQRLHLSVVRIAAGMQQRIDQLDAQGVDIILLLNSDAFSGLSAQHALLLEPDRLVPPLISAMVAGHQMGIILPYEGPADALAGKWKNLASPPFFAVACPEQEDEERLIDAGLALQEQGADVVLLDCTRYQQRHGDFLQKLLGIPVLLPNTLIARLAAELLV